MGNDEKCIFCNIALGKIKSRKVYEDDVICAFLDINPANPGHVLIVPKDHYQILPMVPSDVIAHIFNMAKKISMVMFSEIGSEGTSYFVANGMSAGQKAPHVMMHVIARFEKDNVGLVPETFEVSENDIDKIETKLNESLIKVFEGKGVVTKNNLNKKESSQVVDALKDEDKSKRNNAEKTEKKGENKSPDDENNPNEKKGNKDETEDNRGNGETSGSSNEELDDENDSNGLESKFNKEPKKAKEIDIDKIANMFLK